MSRPQVLIVGAGPTGLVLALWLARAKVPFRLIDGNAGPGTASRAMAVQARTLEFNRQLGIADEVVAAGFKLDRLRLHNRSRELAVAPLGDVGSGISPFAFGLSLPQDDHERFLTARHRSAGHDVEWDTELTGFDQGDAGVSAPLRKPGVDEAWDGANLCGCDGAHSAVRHVPGVGFPGGTSDQTFVVADAEAEGSWSDRDTSRQDSGHQAQSAISDAATTSGIGLTLFLVPLPNPKARLEDHATREESGCMEPQPNGGGPIPSITKIAIVCYSGYSLFETSS